MHWLSKKRYKIGLLIPTLLVYSVYIILPIAIAIYYSFTKYSGIGKPKFTGLKNYISLLFNKSAIKNDNVSNSTNARINITIVFLNELQNN